MRALRFTWIAVVLAAFSNAATLGTRDGRFFQGAVQFTTAPDGSQSVTVTPKGGFTLSFKLSDVGQISYRPPLVGVLSGGVLLGEWGVRDVGSTGVAGSSVFGQGIFELRGEGTEFGKNTDSFHMIWQRMPYQGQLTARLERLPDGPGRPLAGLIIRGSLVAQSRYCMIGVGTDGQSGFVFKPNAEGDATVIPGPAIKPPCWLKLTKYGDLIIGSVSADAHKPARDAQWKFVGRLSMENLTDSYIGMMVTSRHAGELATARFDHVSLQRNGLNADFFADGQMTDLRATRIDPKIDFTWTGPPEFNVPENEWWARWTSRLAIPSTDDYAFVFRTNDQAKLWINGQKILDTTSHLPRPPTVHLLAEREYDIIVEFHKIKPGGQLQLYWKAGNQPGGLIPSEAFIYRQDADEAVAAKISPLRRFIPLTRGALLVDGTFLPGVPTALDSQNVDFLYRDTKPMKLPTDQVARLTFQPLANAAANKVSEKGVGLLTQQGEFVEGECQSIDDKTVKLSSVVFGTSTFDVKTQAAAVMLRPAPPGKGWLIHTTSGGVFRATSIKGDKSQLILQEPVIGPMPLPIDEIIDVTAGDAIKP